MVQHILAQSSTKDQLVCNSNHNTFSVSATVLDIRGASSGASEIADLNMAGPEVRATMGPRWHFVRDLEERSTSSEKVMAWPADI